MDYAKLPADELCFIAAESPPDSLPESLPDEITLQALWFSGALGRTFLTTDGEELEVIQFGEWNRGAGPDFLHTSITIAGRLRVGPLELDLRASDWENHGHADNTHFNEVVLHVFFIHSTAGRTFTRTRENRAVPQLIVPRERLAEALDLPRHPVAIARPGRCNLPLQGMSETSILSLLAQAARHRAARRARRFRRVADAHGPDAALFLALAETLGYRPNKLAMTLLAQRLPLQKLRSHIDLIEPALFGLAGFLHPDLHARAPQDSQAYLRELWERWWRLRGELETQRPIHWESSALRPTNHPHRRLGALACIVADWPKFRRLALARPFSPQALEAYLRSLRHPFWSRRFSLSSKASSKDLALFGADRARDFLASHLIPLALEDDPAFDWDRYARLPAPPQSDPVKRAAIRLFGNHPSRRLFVRKLYQHQALLQIYQDFCLADSSGCAACPFPEQLDG
jgi:hypothetical protein